MAYKRNEGKNNADYSLRELYKRYKTNIENPVPYKTFADFLREYNSRIMDAIIYERLEFRMPARVGYVRIQRRRLMAYMKDGQIVKKHIPVDWKRTLDYWRELYPDKTDQEIKEIPNKKVLRHHNEHTNGNSVKFYWDKSRSIAVNQSCYVFKATRTAKEDLARFIKKTGILYFCIFKLYRQPIYFFWFKRFICRIICWICIT